MIIWIYLDLFVRLSLYGCLCNWQTLTASKQHELVLPVGRVIWWDVMSHRPFLTCGNLWLIHDDITGTTLADRSPWEQYHGNIIIYKHLPHYWPVVREVHRTTADFPHKGLPMRSFEIRFSVILNKLFEQAVKLPWIETLESWCHVTVIIISEYRGQSQYRDAVLQYKDKFIIWRLIFIFGIPHGNMYLYWNKALGPVSI